MEAREKPHCGNSGVPFMNRTTGEEATALSIAERVSSDRYRRRARRYGEIGEERINGLEIVGRAYRVAGWLALSFAGCSGFLRCAY